MIDMVLSMLSRLLFLSLKLDSSGSFPRPLSAAEEKEYLERSAAGDMEARNKLIEHMERCIV